MAPGLQYDFFMKKSDLAHVALQTSTVLTAVFLLFIAFGAQAAGQSATNTVNTTTQLKPSRLSIPLSLESAGTLHQQDAYEKQDGLSISISPSYKISNSLTAISELSAYKDLKGDQPSGLGIWLAGLSRSQKLQKNLNWTQGLIALLPTDSKLREDTSYNGSLLASTGLVFSELFFESSASIKLTYKRNLHEYSQTNTGKANIRESLGGSLTEKLNFMSVLGYTTAFSYINNQSFSFMTSIGLSYQAQKKTSLHLAVSNEGNALKPNGTDSNIEFFNNQSSILKFGLTYDL
jgi:hypothetical protein